MRRDSPTGRLTDRLGDVREAGADGGRRWLCGALNDAGVGLGDLRGEAFDADPEMTAEEAMDPGPTTIRPHVPLAEIAEYLHNRDLDSILVTTPDGQLVGMLDRQDAMPSGGSARRPMRWSVSERVGFRPEEPRAIDKTP
jgi:CBS domain-containing protein